MKTLKSLLMLCAGLSFCACNSDNDGLFPEGKGAVTVQIVPPTTRALSDGTAVDGEVVHGDITLTLHHGGDDQTATLYYNAGDKKYYYDSEFSEPCGSPLKVVFYSVVSPSELEATMNGGVSSYDAIAINSNNPNMQATPDAIPVYGSTEEFSLSGNKVGESLEYTATVDLKIPVARLEVNIKGGDLSSFGSVKVIGAYLDHYKPNDGTALSDQTNYYHPDDTNNETVKHGTGTSVLYDSGEYVLTQNAFAPSDEQYFAYNFYATKDEDNATTVPNPKFKLLLSVTKTAEGPVIPTTQYAIIENFVKESAPTTPVNFVNGQIYRITGLVLNGNTTTNNIQVDEEGTAVTYALTATVTQASWGLDTDVTGQWKQ